MAQYKKGSFAASGPTQNITGIGFDPKLVIVWAANEPTAEGYSDHQGIAIGAVAAGAAAHCYAGFDDALTNSSGVNYAPEGNGLVMGFGTTLTNTATLSLITDGFSVNWGSSVSAWLIHYIAIGGSDVQAEIVRDSFVGTGARTISGISFQPDAAIFLHSGTGLSGTGIGMGCAISPTKRWAWSVNALGGASIAANNWSKSYQRTDACILSHANTTEDFRADFTSFNADGCTLNVQTNPGSGHLYAAIFLRTNGAIDIGSFNKATAGSAVDTVTPTFPNGSTSVIGALEATIGKTASTSIQADSKISIGAFDGSAEGCTWSGSNDAVSPGVAKSRFVTTKCLSISSSTTTQAEADGAVSGATFTNTWSTNNGVAEQILWLAVAGAGGNSGSASVSSRKPTVNVNASASAGSGNPSTVKKGTFISSGPTQNITGLGFTPKVVLIWMGNRQATEGYSTHQAISMGAAVAGVASHLYAGYDNGSTSALNASYSPQNPGGLVIGDGATVTQTASLAIIADGFSMDWGGSVGAWVIHYLAIGSSQVTEAAIVTDSFTGTGSKSITGLSFQPDAVIFLQSGNGANTGAFGIGAAISPTKRWALSVNSLGGHATAASNWAKSYQRTDSCLLSHNNVTEEFRADFTSFNSDGCTINVITNSGGHQYIAILLQTGGKIDLGSFAKSTSPGGSNIVAPSFSSGIGTVVGVMEVTDGNPAGTSFRDDSKISIGAFDGTTQGCIWSGSEHGVSPSQSNSRFSQTRAISISSGTTTEAEANASIAGGAFSNVWSTNHGGNSQILWLAFGGQLASTTGTASVSSRKAVPTASGKVGTVGTSALNAAKPVVSVTAVVPVAGISGSAAVNSQKPTVLAGLFHFSGTPTGGEGTGGDFLGGPPEISGTAALVAQKPVIQASAPTLLNAVVVSSRKPVISVTATQGAASGSAAVVAQKPTISASGTSFVVSGTAALASRQPKIDSVPSIDSLQSWDELGGSIHAVGELRFIGTAAVTAQKPTLAALGTVGNVRVAVASNKPTISASGTVALTNFTGTCVLNGRKPTILVGTFNRPKTHLWPRVAHIRAIKGRG